jgi:hypothetical protein
MVHIVLPQGGYFPVVFFPFVLPLQKLILVRQHQHFEEPDSGLAHPVIDHVVEVFEMVEVLAV